MSNGLKDVELPHVSEEEQLLRDEVRELCRHALADGHDHEAVVEALMGAVVGLLLHRLPPEQCAAYLMGIAGSIDPLAKDLHAVLRGGLN
ncbi:hypothetical protein [Lentisalinibacter salinarum]|uniref:hypothetical protein n=1 Tax=Lentisalinibacter salinarum TaxID=2992239 RepID=UPI003868353B